MQQYKNINKNSELEILTKDSEKLVSSLTDVMNKFEIKINAIFLLDFIKSKGIALSSLLSILIILPFYSIVSVSQLIRCGIKFKEFKAKKDAFYDFKNNEFINWRNLLDLHCKRFIYLINNNINLKSNKTTAFIFDDTLLKKSGKKIEKISVVYDHVTNTFILGYKLLVCGFWDGESFIPLDFSLHREKGTNSEKINNEYLKSAKILDKQQNKIEILNVKLKKISLKLEKASLKYQTKANNKNLNNLEKFKNEIIEIEKELSENKSLLTKYQSDKSIAYKKLKHFYYNGKTYGLTKKERDEQFKKAVSTKSQGFKRRKEADKSKHDMMLLMLERAVKSGLVPNYVIIDTWFFSFELLQKLESLKNGAIKLVAMVKIDSKKFTICQTNKELSLKGILKKYEHKTKRCKIKNVEYIPVKCLYKGVRTDLYFVRNGKKQKWHLLLTTDLELKFIKLLEIYQIRWSIEVFFKESKQYLNLGACQSNTFDAQIADITISMMQHIMLTYYKRINYQQKIGGLFEKISNELVELDLVTRLIELFWQVIELFCDFSSVDFIEFQKEIMKNDKIMNNFYKLIPEKVKDKSA